MWEKPVPATFILLTYNQEDFVIDAMTAAVNQDYSPLEIVFSDDCSTDGTFGRMQGFVESYRGPREIRLVRNSQNLGVAGNLISRAREANGEILVVAAGDDVSKPHRVSSIIPTFNDRTVWAASSRYDEIDEHGRLREPELSYPIVYSTRGIPWRFWYLNGHDIQVIQGSTAAYHKHLFSVEFPPGNLGLSEDNLLNVLVYAHGRTVATISESLVLYRKHDRAISHNGSLGRPQLRRHPAQIWAGANRALDGFRSILWIADNSPHGDVVNRKLIRWQIFRATLAVGLPHLVWLRNLLLLARYKIWRG